MSPPHSISKLKYQACHRGTKENDLLLGPYAETFLHSMASAQLDIFAEFLEESDLEIFAWIVHKSTPPIYYQELVADIIKFHDKQ